MANKKTNKKYIKNSHQNLPHNFNIANQMARKSPARSRPTGVGRELHYKEERFFAMEYIAYSSKPTHRIKDKEECVVYSIARRRGGTCSTTVKDRVSLWL